MNDKLYGLVEDGIVTTISNRPIEIEGLKLEEVELTKEDFDMSHTHVLSHKKGKITFKERKEGNKKR